jgi:uncharacterized protein YggE
MNIKQYLEDKKGLTFAGSIALVALTLFLVVGIFAGHGYEKRDTDNPNVITVSGTADVSAAPDIATFSFSVNEDGATVVEAQKKADPKIKAAIAYLKGQGVDAKDIQTNGYNANPKYEYRQLPCTVNNCPPSNPVITGYTVEQTITVKVRDVSKAGTLLGGIGSTGVSNISGLTFTIDNEDGLKAQARSKAIDKARAQAEELAKELHVRLGKITSFNENSGGYYPIYNKAAGMGATDSIAPQAANIEIPPGQNKITSNVTITYEIR